MRCARGEAVQHDADDARRRPLRRPVVAAAQVHVRPGDRVERDVRRRDDVVDGRERAVGLALAQEPDERVQVVGRLARRRSPGGTPRRSRASAAGGGRAGRRARRASARAAPARCRRAVRIGYIVLRKSAASSPTSAPIRPRGVRPWRQSVERARPADLGDPLERQPVPAPLAQHRDRRLLQLLGDNGAACSAPLRFAHAACMLHDRCANRKPKIETPARAGVFRSRPVSRILSRVTIRLCGLPGSSAGRLGGACSPCTGRGLASRRVATALVGSYPTVSPLPSASPEISPPAVSFLCHFPSAFAAWVAPASCPAVSGLSSSASRRPRSPGLRVQL